MQKKNEQQQHRETAKQFSFCIDKLKSTCLRVEASFSPRLTLFHPSCPLWPKCRHDACLLLKRYRLNPFTVFIHVHFQTLFQTARSALVSVSLVDRTATLHVDIERPQKCLPSDRFYSDRATVFVPCYPSSGSVPRWKTVTLFRSYRPAPHPQPQSSLIPVDKCSVPQSAA